ncbi:MAG: preprotein translocase subunit SecE [Alphaproteobacteria bacterium]|nr:preprotein translocase subunit SecE [Alphaproteobacteria bacterium]
MLKTFINYIKNVRLEWFKITWPTRDAVVRATIMIFVFGGLIALFLFFIDSILNKLVGYIF